MVVTDVWFGGRPQDPDTSHYPLPTSHQPPERASIKRSRVAEAWSLSRLWRLLSLVVTAPATARPWRPEPTIGPRYGARATHYREACDGSCFSSTFPALESLARHGLDAGCFRARLRS